MNKAIFSGLAKIRGIGATPELLPLSMREKMINFEGTGG